MRSFDIAFLRSFVAVAEAGTLRQAAERRARSTAAISQQMRALELCSGVALFQRSSGKVSLSDQGRVLLPYAQELIRLNDEALHAMQNCGTGIVRFGMPQDFATSSLAEALAMFSQSHPMVRVDAQVERNSRIAALLDEGSLDLALLIGRSGAGGGDADIPMQTVWLARDGARFDDSAPLPLLLLEEPCLFREYALEALSRAGIPYRVAFTSPSVAGLWGAVQSGMGVTARMPIGLPDGVDAHGTGKLPSLPAVRLSLHRRPGAGQPVVNALFRIVTQALVATPRSPPATRQRMEIGVRNKRER
ncbi:MAG: LysR substrate-binding domain-containing protein [Ramlibacter sp.]